MDVSYNCLNIVKDFEGCSLQAYKDPVGVWTIGYGHTYGVSEKQQITQDEAEQLLFGDLTSVGNEVDHLVIISLNQNQFDALVSFTFNVGGTNLAKSTLLKKLNAGDVSGAAEEFDRWIYAGKQIFDGLVKRRAAEKALFLS
uniref:lysozyme n=1 Tax=Klebsiella sp. TaxID=576 RepID=UPI0031D7B4C2